jgi:alkylation response protein AidB-like acyl-CoA dehydrogenase
MVRAMIEYGEFERAIGLNWYAVDPNLGMLMDRLLDPADRAWAEEHLQRLGALCGGPLAERAEILDKHPPRLERYDRWGEEVCRIVHHPAARAAKRDAWEAGLSGPRLRVEARRRGRAFPAVLGGASTYLGCQADTGLMCAIGMTGGVTGLVERFAPPEVRERLLPRLTAERFEDAFDGAMFMTERTGGSDLGTLTTTAREREGVWYLNGSKWFCSNIDAAAIATLARPDGAPDGIKAVALFVVPRERADGTPNGIRMRRLKDKLGTRTVPTGEVDFVDAEAYLLAGGSSGGPRDGRGINRMMEMVNGSRFGVACMGLGIMRRSFLEAAIYAAHRQAFGRRLEELPLVQETLLGMVVDLEAAAALVFAAAHAIDRREAALARLLVPLAKLRATRQGIAFASAAVEMHGGNGYVEDWPTARLLREAQCHTIWEGTENIICLDVLRALRGEGTAQAALGRIAAATRAADGVLLARPRALLEEAARRLEAQLGALAQMERPRAEFRARAFAGRLADAMQAALLLEEAGWELAARGSARKAVVAALFAAHRLGDDQEQALALAEEAAHVLFAPLLRYGPIAPASAGKVL